MVEKTGINCETYSICTITGEDGNLEGGRARQAVFSRRQAVTRNRSTLFNQLEDLIGSGAAFYRRKLSTISIFQVRDFFRQVYEWDYLFIYDLFPFLATGI